MPRDPKPTSLEEQIDRWRSYLRRRQAIHSVDVAELEDHLREQVGGLVDAGLATDEAFLVAVKRMGDLDALSREFAREHSDRLWKQLVVVSSDSGEPRARARTDAIVAFSLAVAAAVVIKVPALFGIQLAQGGYTEALTALHLPIALWLVVGIAYAGGRWSQVGGRMDFIRFSGELFIYYVLIALGGVVLLAFMRMIFQAIGIDVEPFFESWLLPCGAVGAVVVASWLVEAKQSVIENMAPVLTRLFTPFFAAVLVTFLVTLLWTGRGVGIERNALIAFDLLLVVVLGLLLYSVSARDPHSPPGAFDVVQVVLVVSALLADAVALWAIAARITEFGFSPNRVAALGENVILLVNLAWSAVLYIRFLRGRGSFTGLERWQTDYLPVYAVWAATVVIVFPPVFGYI